MYWYTLHTKPRQERQAATNLEALGVETFCPQLMRRKVIRRRWRNTVGPLFPGYLFARFDVETSFRMVNYATGVRKIVAFGGEPEPLDEEIIHGIRERLTDGCLSVQAGSLRPGQSVQIQSGPLQGLEAIFEREMSDHQRVVLLLRTIESRWRVVLPLEQVANL